MEQTRAGGRRRAQIVVFDAFPKPCKSPIGSAQASALRTTLDLPPFPNGQFIFNLGAADNTSTPGRMGARGIREDLVNVLRLLRYADCPEEGSMRRIGALFRPQNRSLNGRRSTSCVQAERGCRWMCQ